MKIGIDTDKNTLVYDSFFRNPITKIEISRRNSGSILVGFSDQPVALGSRMVELAVKPLDEYNFANFLVYSNAYTLDGAYFNMLPNFNVVAIQSLFALSGENVASIPVSLEMRWSDNSGISWSYSNVIEADIHNNLFAGGELSSFAVSSFLSQIVPILESYTWPINMFNTSLNLDNSNMTFAGSATGITMSGDSDYISLTGSNSKIYVNGQVSAPSLSSITLNTNSISTNSVNSNSITTNFGSIGSVNSVVVNTNTINALTGTIGTLNISSVEVGGFTASGNVIVEGSVIGNTLSGQNLISNTATLNTLTADSITTNTLLLTSVNATSVNTNTLNANTLSSVALSSNSLRTGSIIATSESVGSLSAASILTNSLTVSANNIRILTTNTPASSASPGLSGTLCYDANFIYVYTGSAWKRVALTLF